MVCLPWPGLYIATCVPLGIAALPWALLGPLWLWPRGHKHGADDDDAKAANKKRTEWMNMAVWWSILVMCAALCESTGLASSLLVLDRALHARAFV